MKYKTDPDRLIAEVEYAVRKRRRIYLFIDEIQRCPELLNGVHHLIERFKEGVSFIMTGSSARKLKRSSVNMLAGRAWQYFLFPLTHLELGERFDLDTALLRGTLPPVVEEPVKDAFRTLKAYVQTYLKEEILDEALVRNIGAFSRFLDLAADQSGQIINFSTIARETGVSSKTVKGYYQILEDTLIALKLEPYLKSFRKRLIMHPRYYLFDVGVINTVNGRTSLNAARGSGVYGMLFEHFIILECRRLIHYTEKPYRMYFWRTAHGAEVDLVIKAPDTVWAIEIKSSPVVKAASLSGLRSFREVFPDAVPLCVSTCDRPYFAGDVPVLPWRELFGKKGLDF